MKDLEATTLKVSALMEARELTEGESADFIEGFWAACNFMDAYREQLWNIYYGKEESDGL